MSALDIRWLPVVAALLLGCAEPEISLAPTATHGESSIVHTVHAFGFIDANATMSKVRTKLGEPTRDIGSGIHIYVYELQDGSSVSIGSPDGSDIWYVRHGDIVLYEKD